LLRCELDCGQRSAKYSQAPQLQRGIMTRGANVLKILVVDDSKVMREMIVACLRGVDGLEFSQAASGLEAIERLSLGPFDLMYLDLNMPDIGGFEVVEFVRSQDTLKTLPIVIVTTRGEEATRTRALQLGASSFMTKPFHPEAVIAELRSLLGERLDESTS
jgi:two-component system chemotaxis response regulator CheY